MAHKIFCAAINDGHVTATNCPRPASKLCGRCQLVGYCSRECQTSHWKAHKADCTSALGRENWRPDWVSERRTPAFVNSNKPYEPFGSLEYLLGNVPAIDVLRMQDNEGSQYNKDISVCFAACGDIRNLIKTANGLPQDYQGACDFHVNDRSSMVIVRAVILIILAVQEHSTAIVDCMLHIWYSAFLRADHRSALTSIVEPIVAEVVRKIHNKSPSTLLAKTIRRGPSSVRIMLQKSDWIRVLDVVHSELDFGTATRNRQDIVLHRKDHYHRQLFRRRSYERVACHRFRTNGIIVPFGHSVADYTCPNPTMFGTDGRWLQKDSSDPLDGWWWDETGNLRQDTLRPSHDLYGHLYLYLQQEITAFVKGCHVRSHRFVITQVSIEQLGTIHNGPGFDRIEVSNVMDLPYLGVGKTLKAICPLLRADNPRSTIVALFMNAIAHIEQQKQYEALVSTMGQLQIYLPITRMPDNTNDAEFLRRNAAKDLFLPFDTWFAEYCALKQVYQEGARHYQRPRHEHSIVPKGPWQFRPDTSTMDSQTRFWRHLGSGCTGAERYIEWERMST